MNYTVSLITLLQVLMLCSGHDITTLIETKEELQGTGNSFSDTYYKTSKDLPSTFPSEILDSGSRGIWLFSESEATNKGGLFTLTATTTITKIVLRVYTTKNVTVYFYDPVTIEDEVSGQLDKAPLAGWTEYILEHDRAITSTQSILIRFHFPASTDTTPGAVLVDSIKIMGLHLHKRGGAAELIPSFSAVALAILLILNM